MDNTFFTFCGTRWNSGNILFVISIKDFLGVMMNLKRLAILTGVLVALFLCFKLNAFGMAEQPLGSGISVPILPNLQIGYAYDFSTHTSPITFTSTILSRDWAELRIGYLADNPSGTMIGGLTLNVRKLTLANGGSITYAWDNILDINVGVWYGYDLTQNMNRYGIGATLVKTEFK